MIKGILLLFAALTGYFFWQFKDRLRSPYTAPLRTTISLSHSAECPTGGVARTGFFSHIMGVDEKEFKNTPTLIQNSLIIDQSNPQGGFVLKNKNTNKTFNAGKFATYSIETLRDNTQKKEKKGNGTFNVVERSNFTQDTARVDIGTLQASPDNNDAVFQIASNFSTLEPTSRNHFPEFGISGYVDDLTQGPFGSISAAPGLIYRMYYMFYDPNTPPAQWRQTKDRQINLLEDTDITNENGYIVLSKELLKKIKKTDDESLIKKIKIGYHSDIEVTFGRLENPRCHHVANDKTQRINQVFTAGVDFGNTNIGFARDDQAKRLAQIVLDAAYEGTIKVAAQEGKSKVVLTFVGGGVFKNSLDSIASAIGKNIDFIRDHGLQVTLIIYNSAALDPETIEKFRERLNGFVTTTHGTYTKLQ
jgi:hypothetical protein